MKISQMSQLMKIQTYEECLFHAKKNNKCLFINENYLLRRVMGYLNSTIWNNGQALTINLMPTDLQSVDYMILEFLLDNSLFKYLSLFNRRTRLVLCEQPA